MRKKKDAKNLSEVRLQIDGETENMDRKKGEVYLDENDFKKIIKVDTESDNHLLLVAEVNEQIIGFSRYVGSNLKRTSHKVGFGVCVLKDYWDLLIDSIEVPDSNGIKKIALQVLETNEKAITLYKKFSFGAERV